MEAATQKGAGIRKSLEVAAIIAFVLIGGIEALPCTCEGGAIASNAEFALLLYISFRLIWQVYRRTFNLRDYFVYCALFAAFCFWMKSYV